MYRQLLGLLIAAVIGAGTLARAESGSNPFDAPVIPAGGGPADGSINDPIVQQSIGDVNSIQDNSKANDGRGRREKIEDDAIPKGNAGVGAALAAGISLTAAGTPMLASPILPVKLRGMELLAKAALEFAQAGATAGANQANKKAGDAVNKNADGPTSSQMQSPEDVKKQAAEAINTPELQRALGEAGVNSDSFIDQLTSGELNTPAAVAAAANVDTTGITPEMMASSSSENGKEELPQIVFADGTSNPAPNGGAGGGGGLGGSFSPAESKAGEGGAPTAEVYAQAQAMAAHTLDLAKKAGGDRIGPIDEQALIAKYLSALTKNGAGKAAAMTASDLALYNLGVKKLRAKQNIFHVARKGYHDFGRWRGKSKTRLAQVQGPVVKGTPVAAK